MPAQAIDMQDFDQIQRGRYLTDMGDCGACHTLPGSGRLLAGGRPIETPFGLLLAPNITPDPETGIGAWGSRLGGSHGLACRPAAKSPIYESALHAALPA